MRTHYNNSAGDGDGRQQTVGDGVILNGILDALVLAVDAPLVRPVHQVHDDEGQRCWRDREETADESHLTFNSTHNLTLGVPNYTQTTSSLLTDQSSRCYLQCAHITCRVSMLLKYMLQVSTVLLWFEFRDNRTLYQSPIKIK